MKYCVTINNKRYEVEVEKGDAAIVKTTEIAMAVAPKIVKPSEQTTEVSPGVVREVVKAPMAGAIMDIKVNVGSAVKKGDILLLLEAMKMENEITAHVDGIVTEIKVDRGACVSAEDVLVVLK